MLIYTVLLAPVTVAPAMLGIASWIYGAAAAALSAVFVASAVAVVRDGSERNARRMFAFSILYLFLLFALLMADRLIAWHA